MDDHGESSGAVEELKKAQRAVGSVLLAHFRQSVFSAASLRASVVRSGPLVAACAAPLSTLFDIASLGEPWYSVNGVNLPDPKANTALSAIEVAVNIVAISLLVLRFNSTRSRWKASIAASTVFYAIKLVLAAINLSIFRIPRGQYRNVDQYERNSSFWCAVVSAALAGFITAILTLYIIVARYEKRSDNEDTRVQGRHFMLGELALFAIIALEALIFSKVEGYPFFESVYFSIVTALTIGYGDYVPRQTVTRILLFPFTLLEIAFLASQISIIVAYLKDGSLSNNESWRKLYEKERERNDLRKTDCDEHIVDEIQYLKRLVAHEDRIARAYELAISSFFFLVFWVAGSAVYSAIEGWAFGSSLYFSFVTFFSIGYGDYYAETAVGRVFFVVWAILAVPLIASFAIQTVTSIWTSVQQDILEKSKIQRGVEPGFDKRTTITVIESDGRKEIHPFVSHAELVTTCHKSERQKRASQAAAESEHVSEDERNPLDTSLAAKLAAVDLLADEVLEQAFLLEAYARRIMLDKFERGSKPRLLLQADQNLQRRAIDQPAKETEKSDYACPQLPDGPSSELEDVHMYRRAFARLLWSGARLKRLEGQAQVMFERRSGQAYNADGSPVLASTPEAASSKDG